MNVEPFDEMKAVEGSEEIDHDNRVETSVPAPSNTATAHPSQVKSITFFEAVLLPGVIPYSLAYACIKVSSHIKID